MKSSPLSPGQFPSLSKPCTTKEGCAQSPSLEVTYHSARQLLHCPIWMLALPGFAFPARPSALILYLASHLPSPLGFKEIDLTTTKPKLVFPQFPIPIFFSPVNRPISKLSPETKAPSQPLPPHPTTDLVFSSVFLHARGTPIMEAPVLVVPPVLLGGARFALFCCSPQSEPSVGHFNDFSLLLKSRQIL